MKSNASSIHRVLIAILLTTGSIEAQSSKLLFAGCGGLCLMDPVVGAEPEPLAAGLYEALEERRGLSGLIPYHVSWSPDGNTIAFTARWSRANNQISVWSIRSDGSELRFLIEQEYRYGDGDYLTGGIFGICWSPTEEQLAIAADGYSELFNQFTIRTKIGLIAIDGIEIGAIQAPILHNHSGVLDWAGERLYYTDYEYNLLSIFANFDLRFASDDESGIDSLGVGLQPEVSPDGTTLAFRRGGTNNDFDPHALEEQAIYLVDLSSREETLLAYGTSPTWSPDSQKIAFVERESYEPEIKINIINADGTGLETIYEYTQDPHSEFTDIDWSPWLDDIATGVSPASWGTVKREFPE